MTTHDLPAAIQWHEGMLLAPQHFQQLQQRAEALLHYHAAALEAFHWGVRHLRIDTVLLVDGTFRVLDLEAVMPDGLLVSSREGENDLALDLAELADRIKQGPLTVHLAVAAGGRGHSPVRGEMARFDSIDGDLIADENTGESELRIPRLRPRLRLVPGDEAPPKFVSFPLAQIVYEDENFTLGKLVPPVLRVGPKGSSARLHDLCSDLAKKLRGKAVFLADQVNSPQASTRAPQLLETKNMVHSLVAALPPFEAQLSAGASHPYDLFLSLSSLVGHVAAISRGLVPPVLEGYDHNDPWRSFTNATSYLTRVLDEGINETFTAYRFNLENGVFVITFDTSWSDRQLVLGVRRRPGSSERETTEWLEQSVIGSTSKMVDLRERRILGAPRSRVERDADLVPASGVTLFSLTPDPAAVVGGETLEVRNLDDPAGQNRPVEIVLYVRNEA